MAIIDFSSTEKEILVRRIQVHMREELGQKLGQFDAEFLLDFFAEEVGVYFYNRGLYDARAVLEHRLEDITEAIYEIEKPTEFMR